MSSASRDFLNALWGFDATVRRLSDEDWSRLSPCDRWNVGRLVQHNALLCWSTVEMIEGRPMAVPQSEAPDGVPVPHPGYVFRPSLFADFPGRSFVGNDAGVAQLAWRTCRNQVIEAIDASDALLRKTMSPWGHETVDSWLGFLFYDTVVHTWDLATASSQEVVIDPELIEAAKQTLLKMSESHEIRSPISLAPERSVSEEATPLEQLIAFSGRDPHWTEGERIRQ